MLSLILKGKVAVLEYRPKEQGGMVLSAILRDRFEFGLLLPSQRATKLGHQDGKIPRTANSFHSMGFHRGKPGQDIISPNWLEKPLSKNTLRKRQSTLAFLC